jgi:hypothetical protein
VARLCSRAAASTSSAGVCRSVTFTTAPYEDARAGAAEETAAEETMVGVVGGSGPGGEEPASVAARVAEQLGSFAPPRSA